MRKPLNVAYLIFRTRENTGSKVVFQQATELRKRGHLVNIYTLFGKNALWFPSDIKVSSIISYFMNPKPDIIIATFWPTAYVARFLKASKKFYLIMGWEEDFYSNKIIRFFARNSYKLPLQKIVLSAYLKKRLYAYTRKKEKVDKVITYVIEDFFFSKDKIKKGNKKEISILSVISWYNRYKGPDLLVKVIQHLKLSHSNYKFILVGREPNSYSPVIDSFYSNPSSKKLAKLYQEADVLLVTSRVEGFYIPGLEALASGCPVITTNSGGVLEYAVHNKTAVVVDDISEIWKKELIDKVVKNREFRNKLITNGYVMARKFKSHTREDIGKHLEEIISA